MVTPSTSPSDVPSVASFNRGFIPEETLVAGPTGTGLAGSTLYRPFWRPVLAGAFFTLATFAGLPGLLVLLWLMRRRT